MTDIYAVFNDWYQCNIWWPISMQTLLDDINVVFDDWYIYAVLMTNNNAVFVD